MLKRLSILLILLSLTSLPALAKQNANGEEITFRLIMVKHVYVGGIAALFKGNSGTISTEPFVSPAFSKPQSSPFNFNSGQQSTFRF